MNYYEMLLARKLAKGELPPNAYLLKEASGSLVSFSDGADLPMPSFICNIDAVQDLHGYSKPWAGGAGKNKFDFTDTTVTSSRTIASDISLKAGSYIIAFDIKNNSNIGGYYQVRIGTTSIGGVNFGANYSGRLSTTFTLSEDSVINIFVAGASSGYSFDFSNGQIELGSTATTYEPYSNICPIIGWDEVNVGVSGVNLFDKTTIQTGYVNDETGVISTGAGAKCTDFIRVLPNTSYYIKSEQTSGMWGAYYDENKNYVSGVTSYSNSVKTTPSNAKYVRLTVSYNNSGNVDTFGINYPSTDTDYHAYNGATYTIDLDGTRYGGTLDVVSGVLTVDRVSLTVDENSNVFSGSGGLPFRIDLLTGAKASSSSSALTGVKCNFLKEVTQSSSWGVDGTFSRVTTDAKIVYFKVNSEITTIQQLKTFLQSNNLQFVYELATPQTIQLTPTQIKSLLGNNNAWCSAGDVTLEYFGKGDA